MRAITSALSTRDPAEQTARLIEGVDRAVFVNAGSETPQSELATSLMRVITSALSVPEPELVLIQGTGEAIRRHELRRRQGEIAREPAEEVPTVAQDAPPPDPRLITDRAELKRLQREAGYSSQLGVARDLVPGFRDLEGRRKKLLVEQSEAENKRQELGRERDDALKAEQTYHQGLSWWQHKLTEWKIVRDDNIPALRQAVTEAEAKLAAHLESETTLQARLTAVDAAMTTVLDRVVPTVAAYEQIGEIARHRLREHYEAEHEAGRKPGLAQWQERPMETTTTTTSLYYRYKAERDAADQAREAAVQEVYDRFAAYDQQARNTHNLRIEQEKAAVQSGHARHEAIEILNAIHRGDRVEVHMQRDAQLAAAYRDHPLPNWESWLKREADRGDREAARALEQRQAQERENGIER